MKIIEIAQEIYTSELGSPSDLSVSSISFWLRESGVGKLNNALGLDLTIGTDAQLSDELTEAQKAIYKQLYMVHYYDVKVRETLSNVDMVVEISDFGTSVRKTSKSEIAKNWLSLRKEAKTMLDEQLDNYGSNRVSPVQITGDDTIYSLNGGLSNSLTSDSVYP